jgi:hypothetical protein
MEMKLYIRGLSPGEKCKASDRDINAFARNISVSVQNNKGILKVMIRSKQQFPRLAAGGVLQRRLKRARKGVKDLLVAA